MTDNTSLSTTPQKRANLRAIMRQDDIVSRFNEVLGNSLTASAYISSVVLEVANREELQRCSANSIIASAIRAATLRLSVDSATGQAYLVPFKGACTLIVGYKGIYQMALRTNKYRSINMIDVHQDQNLVMDLTTGNYYISRSNGDKFIPAAEANPSPVVGHLLYFKLTNGFEKTFFMSCVECEAHGAKYSKTYNSDKSPWKTETEKMHQKTVMRMGLLKWGYLDPGDMMAMNAVDEQDTVDGEVRYTDQGDDGVTTERLGDGGESKPQSYEEYASSLRVLGFEPDPREKWEADHQVKELEETLPEQPPSEPVDDSAPQPEQPAAQDPAPKQTSGQSTNTVHVTSVMYWNAANTAFDNDHDKGKAFLMETHKGDMTKAYKALVAAQAKDATK